jgi:hypothetical protein
VKVRGILAAFLAALVLTVSLSSVACDLSCAFSQLALNCDAQGTTIHTAWLAEPMHLEGMDHAHCKHQPRLGQIELKAIHTSFSMGSCQHQPCAKPATLSLQKIRPTAPQFAHAVLTVVAHLQPDDTFVMMHHFDSGSLPLNLSALDPLSTSLRI